MRSLRTVARSIRDFYDEMFLFVPLSVVWWLPVILVTVLVIPLARSLEWWLILPLLVIAVIPVAPLTAGLCYVGYRIAHELRVDFGFFKEAVREYFLPSLRLGILDLVIVVTVVINLFFYSRFANWLRLITIIWIYVLILWAVAQLYLFPLLFEQREPKALSAVRNAAILALAQPLFTLGVFLLALILTILCAILPVLLILVWPGLMALIATRALASVLEQARASMAQDENGEGNA
ncbi:MAG: hypothetical protein GXP39_14405 [Chloroflexi bacterium]|nr:hypothetical protein [Chloroflexota bacterium]